MSKNGTWTPHLKQITPSKGKSKYEKKRVPDVKKQIAEAKKSYLQMPLKHFRKKGKYHNVSQEFEGRRYDSRLEAKFAQELSWRKKAGEITEVIPQYKFDLSVNGLHITNYFIDFKVVNSDGSVTFYECKGVVLPLWQLKFRLTQALLNELEPGAELVVIK